MSAFVRATREAAKTTESLLCSGVLQLRQRSGLFGWSMMGMQAHYNVLFLCTGNSARSSWPKPS